MRTALIARHYYFALLSAYQKNESIIPISQNMVKPKASCLALNFVHINVLTSCVNGQGKSYLGLQRELGLNATTPADACQCHQPGESLAEYNGIYLREIEKREIMAVSKQAEATSL